MEDITPSTAAPPQANPSEALFLILHHLRHNTPCQEAARLLEAEAIAHGLLPRCVDVDGGAQPASYTQLQHLHPDLPPNALLEILNQQLLQTQARPTPIARHVTTLLGTGMTHVWGVVQPASCAF